VPDRDPVQEALDRLAVDEALERLGDPAQPTAPVGVDAPDWRVGLSGGVGTERSTGDTLPQVAAEARGIQREEFTRPREPQIARLEAEQGWDRERAIRFLAAQEERDAAQAERDADRYGPLTAIARTAGAPLKGLTAGLVDVEKMVSTPEMSRAADVYAGRHWQARVAPAVGEVSGMALPVGVLARGATALGIGKMAATPVALGAFEAARTPGGLKERGTAALGGAAMGAVAGPVTAGLGRAMARVPALPREVLSGAGGFAAGGAALDPNPEHLPEHAVLGGLLHLRGGIGKMRAEARPPAARPIPEAQKGAAVEAEAMTLQESAADLTRRRGEAAREQAEGFRSVEAVEEAIQGETGRFRATEDRVLGPNADRWRAAQREQGSADPARAAKAEAAIAEIEGRLAPKDRDALYGARETGMGPEDLRVLRDEMAATEGAESPADLGGRLAHQLERATRAEGVDRAVHERALRHGLEQAEARGWGRAEVERATLAGFRERYRDLDPADAEFMLRQVTGAEAAAGAAPALAREAAALPAPRAPEPAATDRGFVAAGDMADAASGAGRGAIHDVKRWLGSLTERVRSYGKPSAVEAADKAEVAIDRAKAHYGAMSAEIDAVLKPAGLSPRVVANLSRFHFEPGKSHATAPFVEIGEGRARPSNAAEQKIMDAERAFVMRRGRKFEEVGTRRVNPETGDIEPFRAAENVMPRAYTAEGMDVILKGPESPAWKPLVRGIAEMNGTSPEAVEKVLRERRKTMVEGGPESADAEAHAEHFRMWQRFPAAVKTPNGSVVPILETNPYTYTKRLAETGAARMGVIEAFGQDIGAERPFDALRRRFADETGSDAPFVELGRALHRVPVSGPLVTPGTRKATVVRGAKAAGDVLKEGMLSVAAVPNVFEPLGNTMSMGGVRDFVRGTLKQAAIGSRARRAGIDELESKGAIDKQFANLTGDPSRPVGGAVRAFREVAGRAVLGRKWIEQAGGTNAGFVAREVRNRMAKRGGGESVAGEGDVFTLRRLGFDPATARRMAYGKGTAAEYDTFLRRSTSRLLGENMAPAEMSRAEHSRLAQGAFAFQRFAQMNIRDAARVFDTTARSFADAFKNRSWRQAVGTTQRFAAWATGKAVSNAAATLALSFLTGGTTGVKAAWEEAEGDLGAFLAKSFQYGVLAGPFGAVLRTTSGNQNLGDAIFPYTVAKEVVEAVAGTGRYRYDEGLTERLGTFVDRFAPVKRAFTTGAIAQMFGDHTEARRIEVAKRAYWRWRAEEIGDLGRGPRGEVQDYTKKMRKAYQAILEGDHVRADAMVRDALSDGKRHQWKRSINDRLLLGDKEVKAKLSTLKARIGEEAYGLLEAHDRLLRAYSRDGG
jgi:hypothetical protein